MKKHYIEIFDVDAHCVGEKYEIEPGKQDFNIVQPYKGAIAYRFFDQREIKILGITIKGVRTNVSKLVYWGEIYTLEEIEKYFPNEKKLIYNMRSNGWIRMVKTPYCGWHLLRKDAITNPNFC